MAFFEVSAAFLKEDLGDKVPAFTIKQTSFCSPFKKSKIAPPASEPNILIFTYFFSRPNVID